MKIGIISDTHDNMAKIASAVEFFKKEGIETVLHLGDHTAPFSVNPFKNSGIKVIAIWGNNEGEKLYFRKTVQSMDNFELNEIRPHRLELAGKRILMMHEPDFLEIFEKSGEFDLIGYGHVHKIINRNDHDCLVINPGEACGYLSGKSTVAIVDLETLTAKIHEI